ncbi:arp2/3 complex 21 kDa subunit [Capsaspora owczarzaki ATCC 30864]|uniref:Actin-related protein 2/3 complex subunit 3 n=1 Tax=Capsaspora owczarzaki (strain ATCC 30864) TaxID=595528 RepID=A0A0D2WQ51_CAPO3|nr:arp2/3 complex 21 kDa subunit [Capsaspora owczarzaki ATCC 30864]KJE93700.1 arp2/3 complex 21 kDa subunit [Capsaspora owczarzaki ATCC 30864]|eukprot:XP_004348282.1 arp2/3 complex 21 kDa subunit [Capsaspora owczarzaki ATCC 30864]
MPAYHSNFNELPGLRSLGNFAFLPLNSSVKGPAPRGDGSEDIVEEALKYFKANVFFKNFDIKGNADRVLIYLTLYITDCLQKLAKCPTKNDGLKAMNTMSLETFSLPGDKNGNFPLNGLYQLPEARADADTMRQYITQLRQEIGIRLCERVYKNGPADKWWMCFQKRRFLNKSLDGRNAP